jgi:hypothetical protein
MIKLILSFLILFGIFYMGIEIFRMMTGKEKWEMIKTICYSLAISAAVVVSLTILVVLF